MGINTHIKKSGTRSCFLVILTLLLLVGLSRLGGKISSMTILPSGMVASSIHRPVMATFFEPVEGGCCGMTAQGHLNLVHTWEQAWQSQGWDTRILTMADAKRHPQFQLLEEKLIQAKIDAYNQRCFWRWLAMAVVKVSENGRSGNGGWMTDYDFFPLTLTAEIGEKLAEKQGFKSWAYHVPTLIHADKASWEKVTNLMIETFSEDLKLEQLSDMILLRYLYEHFSKRELNITLWEFQVFNGFPYHRVEENGELQIDCEISRTKLGAHLSHYSSEQAVKYNIFPIIEGMHVSDHAEKRAEAAAVLMRDYHEKCS